MKSLVTAALLVALAGCGKSDPIRQYRAPKDPTWRMLAAILPRPDHVWFFKTVGDGDLVRSRREEFLGFLRTVDATEPEMRWKLPAGWQETRGAGERYATLQFGASEPHLEVSVTRMPGDGGGVLANVNRWRNQMALEPITEAELDRNTTRVDAVGAQAVLVDLEGPRKPSAPGMAGRQRAAPPAGGEASLDRIRSLFSYDVPPGWVENRQPEQGRVLEFQAGPADRAALVTLTILSDSAGGPALNVNRWRGQVGLEPVDEEAAVASARPVLFLGNEGLHVELVGKERAILCTFAMGPPFSIFLKVDGPADVVLREKASFEIFSATLKTRKHG